MKIKMHLLGTSIMVLLSVYAVTAYAGQGIREQKRAAQDMIMPEIQYREPDGNQGYYKVCPEIRIFHRQAGAVTKYEFLAADNTKKEGSLELMEGQAEESVYLAGEDLKDGENILRVWMEIKPTKPDENETEGDGSEEDETGGSGTGGNESEENGTGGNESEENGTGGNGSEGNGTENNGSEKDGVQENESEKDAAGENQSEESGVGQNEPKKDGAEENQSEGNHMGEEGSGENDTEKSPSVDNQPDTVGKEDTAKDDPTKDQTIPAGEPEIVFEKEIHFLIDTKKPRKVQFSYNQAVRDNSIFVNEPVELTVKSEDEGSGMEAIYYETGNGSVGVLKGGSGTITLTPGFGGTVEAYAVDKAGNQSETARSERILCEDTSPDIQIETGSSLDTWNSEPVKISVKVSDASLSSGIRNLKCYAGGGVVVNKENDFNTEVTSMEAGFTVDTPSEGGKGIPVIVEAFDWAGNYHSETRLVYFDNTAPAIRSEGIHDQLIAGKPVKGKMAIQEENDLAHGKMEVWKINSGKKRELLEEKTEEPVQFSGAQEIEWDIALEEDGIYEVHVTAKDRAGHESSKSCRIILDKTNPVIRYVDQMQGVYVPYFQWNYGKEEVVQDDTEYSYDIFLDGMFYTTGKRVTKEGAKMLQVRAVDAAGNESTAEAVFQIDHTPPKIRIYDVEDGTSYQDTAGISISVDGKGEYLKEISVNSEKMKLEANCQIFTQSFQEPGDYQIQVLAEDLAGNQEREQITFHIEEQKQLAGGVWKPITRIFRNVKETPDQAPAQEEAQQKKNPAVWLLVLCFALAALARVVKLKIGLVKSRKRKYSKAINNLRIG